MADVSQKLYPPIISSSIPAFYKENGGTSAKIDVPFSMSRAVDSSQVSGFALKIKTVQTNVELITLETVLNIQSFIMNRVISFNWTDATSLNKVTTGQFLKVQLAYIDKSGNKGYFSTVSTVKCTERPDIYIEGLQNLPSNRIANFEQTYVGVCELKDTSERPYSFNFYLYNSTNELIETSGWILHNSKVETENNNVDSLNKTIDKYTFQTQIQDNLQHYIMYKVKTINGLELSTPNYPCILTNAGSSGFMVDLLMENNYDEGYINLSLKLKEGINLETSLSDEAVSIEISRAEKSDGYSSWKILKKVYFTSYYEATQWSFKDFTIEQGINYRYSFRQYQENKITSKRVFGINPLTNENFVMADFEDMFLFDGQRQLKIKFNPKVNSFKITQLESKTDTIGGRYPFIFKNGIVNYKEFPISGLISYLSDENELFLRSYEDLNLMLLKDGTRNFAPYNMDNNYNTPTTNLVGYNISAERKFKLKTLEWLNDGKIKLFKSPVEGNYLIRVMNVSLAPVEQVGRMLHTFSATAYEVEELTYENLVNLKFISTAEEDKVVERLESVSIYGQIVKTIETDNYFNMVNSIQLNNHNIINSLRIELTPSASNPPYFWVRLGKDSIDNKVLIQGNNGLFFTAIGNMPDVYFNFKDNTQEENLNSLSNSQKLALARSLVGDAILTYMYEQSTILTGNLNNIDNVYISNKIFTLVGPTENDSFSFNNFFQENNTEESVLKFFVLDFKEKGIIDVYKEGNSYYLDRNKNVLFRQSEHRAIFLYNVIPLDSTNQGVPYLCYCKEDGGTFWGPIVPTTKIKLYYTNSSVPIEFNEIPILSLNEASFDAVSLSNNVYLTCAYQSRTIQYKS